MRTKFARKLLLTGASSAILAGISVPAFAQAVPGDQSGNPRPAVQEQDANDIIVTARRVEEKLQDVPISITVFNQQQLNNRNVTSGVDLANYTPSLSAGTLFGTENTTFSIRGFYQDPGTQPSVGVYFADVVAPRGSANNLPIGDGAGPGDFFDLQNVQVLNGPQGTLFGRNTTGGAILLVPQKPTSEFGGYVEATYGNYDRRRIQGVLNIPLSNTARLRVGIDHQERDGFVNNDSGIGPKRFNDVHYTAARASLVVDVTPDIENYTIASYLRSDSVGYVQKLIAALSPTAFQNPVAAGGALLPILATAQLAREAGTDFFTVQNTVPNPRTLLTVWRAINTTTWHASSSLTVKNIVSYAQLREKYRSPLFGTEFDAADFPAIPNPRGTIFGFVYISPYAGKYTAAQSTFTEELQVQGTGMDGKLAFQLGGYFEATNPLGTTGNQTPVLTNCSDPVAFICNDPIPAGFIPGVGVIGAGTIGLTVSQTKTRNYGIYAQGTYSLTDQLKLTAGIRYTWDRVSDFNILRDYKFLAGTQQLPTVGYTCTDPAGTGDATFHPPSNLDACRIDLVTKSQKPTWLIDLDYKPNEDLLVYAKWARGYRAGGLVPQAPVGFKTYEPEKVDDFEIGLKSTIRGALNATFNIAGFYNNFSNQQLLSTLVPLQPGVTSASGIVNAGKSRIYGVEVESSITPLPGLTFDGSYTYLNATLRSVNNISTNNGVYAIAFPALAGDVLPLSPRHKFSITGTYTLPLNPSVGKISLSATLSYSSRQLSNYTDKPPYYLSPLGVGSVDIPGVGTVPSSALGGTIVPCPSSPFGCEQVTVPDSIRQLSYQPPRALLNLNLNWNGIAGSSFDLQLFATNVTNKKYYSFVSGNFVAVGFETAQLGEPRMFGARLKYRFGN